MNMVCASFSICLFIVLLNLVSIFFVLFVYSIRVFYICFTGFRFWIIILFGKYLYAFFFIFLNFLCWWLHIRQIIQET